MPDPAEIAELRVNGSKYRDWTSVTVEKVFGNPATTATFSAASPIESSTWSDQKLKVGDKFEAFLAGVKVADGIIFLRQVAYDARQHSIRLQACSKVADLLYDTVEQGSGFQNKTLAQIGSKLTERSGIKFKIDGSPSGADKPFPRFHPWPGESIASAIARLCRMRNLFLMDDESGTLIAKRLDGTGEAVAHLEEGRNILSASCVMSDENPFSKIQALGSQPGKDERWSDPARDSSAAVTNSAPGGRNRTLTVKAEEPGDSDDMKMRAEHQAAVTTATMLQAEITVQGWHAPDGSLWIKHCGKQVTVKSPMLFPDKMSLSVQGVVHSQSPAGSLTTLSLVIPYRLVGGSQIKVSGEPAAAAASPAKPETPDVGEVTSV